MIRAFIFISGWVRAGILVEYFIYIRPWRVVFLSILRRMPLWDILGEADLGLPRFRAFDLSATLTFITDYCKMTDVSIKKHDIFAKQTL